MNLFFKDPQTILRMREGPLGHYIDSYAAELCAEGYAHGSAVVQIRIVADFSRWLAKSRITAQEITAEHFQSIFDFEGAIGARDAATIKL
jgi:hypothetical protein